MQDQYNDADLAKRGNWTSASSAAADRACPGRFQAQIGLPEPEQSPEAESGEIIHAIWTGMKLPQEEKP